MNGTTNQNDWRQTRREARRSRCGPGGSGLMGILFIAVGALYLGSNLGWLPEINFRSLWPVILIALGVSDLARFRGRHFPFFGVVMTSVGTIFLLQNFGILPRNVWRFIWPGFLILIGISMLFRRNLARPDWGSSGSTTTSANSVREQVTFGGIRRKIQSQEFEGGSVYVTFGGVQLDLREAATNKPEITIEAFAKFGGIEIRVPDNWDVTVSGSGMFGAFEDETSAKATPGLNRSRLLVTGEAIFGGVTVKN